MSRAQLSALLLMAVAALGSCKRTPTVYPAPPADCFAPGPWGSVPRLCSLEKHRRDCWGGDPLGCRLACTYEYEMRAEGKKVPAPALPLPAACPRPNKED